MLPRMGPVALKPIALGMAGVARQSAERVVIVAIRAVSLLWVLIQAVRDTMNWATIPALWKNDWMVC